MTSKLRRFMYVATPTAVGALFAAAAIEAAIGDLRPWLSPLVIAPPILLSITLVSCALLARSFAYPVLWKISCVVSLAYLFLDFYTIPFQVVDLHVEVFRLIAYAILLGASVTCIRALSRTADEA